MGKLVDLARSFADKYGIDQTLVCAVCEQESGWDPWATRFEPAFYLKYTKPMSLSDTEEYTRAISFGLMQIMGEVARELGFTGRYLAELCEPVTGLDYGCKKLTRCLAQAGGDVTKALLKYNGGGNQGYPGEVMARMPKYQVLTFPDGP
jgi:soluble lytic murein transglycosylase-like protein